MQTGKPELAGGARRPRWFLGHLDRQGHEISEEGAPGLSSSRAQMRPRRPRPRPPATVPSRRPALTAAIPVSTRFECNRVQDNAPGDSSLDCARPESDARLRGEKGVGHPSRLCALSALVGTLVLALMASTAGAAPLVDRFHDSFSDTFPDNVCGIDGTSAINVVANVQEFADGTFKLELNQKQVFTSAATGKSVLIAFAAQQVNTGPIDNGDGTVTSSRPSRDCRRGSSCRTAESSHATPASSVSTTPSMRRPASSSGRRSRP